MPYTSWEHSCAGTVVTVSDAICGRCGKEGQFVGWRFRRLEAMARYQYITGVKPIGPHRKLADQLLYALRAVCSRCGGVGLITIDSARWVGCAACEGTG